MECHLREKNTIRSWCFLFFPTLNAPLRVGVTLLLCVSIWGLSCSSAYAIPGISYSPQNFDSPDTTSSIPADMVGYSVVSPAITAIHSEWTLGSIPTTVNASQVYDTLLSVEPFSHPQSSNAVAGMRALRPRIRLGIVTQSIRGALQTSTVCSYTVAGQRAKSCGIAPFRVGSGDKITVDLTQVDAGQWSLYMKDESSVVTRSGIIYFPYPITTVFVGTGIKEINPAISGRYLWTAEINGHAISEFKTVRKCASSLKTVICPTPLQPYGFSLSTRKNN